MMLLQYVFIVQNQNKKKTLPHYPGEFYGLDPHAHPRRGCQVWKNCLVKALHWSAIEHEAARQLFAWDSPSMWAFPVAWASGIWIFCPHIFTVIKFQNKWCRSDIFIVHIEMSTAAFFHWCMCSSHGRLTLTIMDEWVDVVSRVFQRIPESLTRQSCAELQGCLFWIYSCP